MPLEVVLLSKIPLAHVLMAKEMAAQLAHPTMALIHDFLLLVLFVLQLCEQQTQPMRQQSDMVAQPHSVLGTLDILLVQDFRIKYSLPMEAHHTHPGDMLRKGK